MGVEPLADDVNPEDVKRQITSPRPGHADLVGGMKYGHRDLRNVLNVLLPVRRQCVLQSAL